MRYRHCELGHCEPTKVIFGVEYGTCPLKTPCPDDAACGYAMSRYYRSQNEVKDILAAGPTASERRSSHMKNDNDMILERLRGVPANKPSWRDKIDTGNPNVIQTNDNQPTRPSRRRRSWANRKRKVKVP